MKIRNILVFIFLMGNLAYGDDCAKINEEARNMIAQNDITGMAIAIVNQGKVEFCNYGYASKDKKSPISEKSIFEIASITKTFTAFLAGITAADGQIDLGAPITRNIPELSSNKSYSHISMKDLLTHVSGLPLIFDDGLTEQGLVNSSIKMEFNQPDQYYQYSNPGIALAGLAMTRFHSGSFQSILDSLVFAQLGMEYTSIDVKPKHQYLVVTGYNRKDQPVDFMQIGINNPAGGLKSNTLDLSKYLEAQMSDQSSKFQEALNIVHKNYHCLYENGTYQQLVWEYHPAEVLSEKFQPDPEGRNILPPHKLPTDCKVTANGFTDKTGNSPGVTSYIGYIQNKKSGVVILANRSMKPDIVSLGRYVLKKMAAAQ